MKLEMGSIRLLVGELEKIEIGRTNQRASFNKEGTIRIENTNQRALFSKEDDIEIERTNQRAASNKE